MAAVFTLGDRKSQDMVDAADTVVDILLLCTAKGRLMQLATYAAMSVSVILVGAKLVAWIVTGSIAILSSLVDSLLDSAASLVNLIAVRHALQPADLEHRFGHGKAEPLAGLGQSAFTIGSALFLSIQAVNNLFRPALLNNVAIGLSIMLLSLALTILLLMLQTYVIRRTQSVAISADSLHYLGDLLINGSVIAALGVTELTGWYFVDPLLAFLIALYILRSASRIMVRSFNLLMDREFSEQNRQRIHDIVVTETEVIDMHDLRTRSSGPRDFIQLRLELDRNLPLWHAHEIADRVESQLSKVFPTAEVLIHQDPSNLTER